MSKPVLLVCLLVILIVTSQFEWRQPLVELDTATSSSQKQQQISDREEAVKEKRKMDGLERSVEIIPEVEIYNFEPWDLPDKSIVKSDSEWFFFCARGKKYPHGSQNRRATKIGYWKATGKERNVKSGSEVHVEQRERWYSTFGRARQRRKNGMAYACVLAIDWT
ncbi:NAC domain [Arabidopsis thaliana x Arabidopsis arenosa]|uniref:NAC domain n=1 Tax=Arabidopsis thaliana x Arabidopsis arenosa TaxID=1240361 RepID=A0A8T2ET50_9BRAS|nr:NAC domain [Arabidopsis thaliana x Arabidopsis arenosa]